MVVPINEGVLERKGCPLHYWTAGPEGRPLVVFTHGACVDHHSFDPHVPVIAQHYRVLTWDVRGHGESQPMGERFTVPLAVDDLMALLDLVGYEKAAIVGHSNGTYITQELAYRFPERVKAMLIADGTCITWIRSRSEIWALHFTPSLMALFPFETLKKAGLKYASLKPEVQEYTYRAFSQISKHDYFDILKGVYGCLHYEPDYHISQPLLLTHGDDDRMGDIKKIAPLWAQREPNCQYVVIPDARHFAILDNPDFFNRLLLEFLSKWVPPGLHD
jgi:pimeloyl-ACP methyl ester carboxylesterase